MLNRPHGGRPAELADLGTLRVGPFAADDRNLVHGRGRVLDVRLPWALLGFSDPSALAAWAPRADGTLGSERVRRVGIGVAAGRRLLRTRGYAWEPWHAVRWRERPKAGWPILAHAFARASAR
jgi:hypothetical protein